MSTIDDYLNYISGIINVLIWTPQIVRIFRKKNVKDLSILTLLAALISNVLFVAWAILNNIMSSYIMAGANILVLTSIIITKIILDIIIPCCNDQELDHIW